MLLEGESPAYCTHATPIYHTRIHEIHKDYHGFQLPFLDSSNKTTIQAVHLSG